MPTFIKGKELCRRFFNACARPVLWEYFPGLAYTAGLLGYGSDVLGYDDAVSTDHMWGPRFYLFLKEEDMPQKENVLRVLGEQLPCTFCGYSVNFSAPDPNDNGVQHPEFIAEGPVRPLVWVQTFADFLQSYAGIAEPDAMTPVDWLAVSEHRLLALTAGELFEDGLQVQKTLDKLRFYPREVLLYLVASNWSLIAEEQAFVRRCAEVGDEIGSALVCGRMAERLMRLAFLYCGQYAPYSKWFGTAFARLPVGEELKTALHNAVTSGNIDAREENLVRAQVLAAEMHNASGLTAPVDFAVQSYFGRSGKVIFAEVFAEAAQEQLRGTALENVPLIGSMSGVANFSVLWDDPRQKDRVKKLYE